MTHGDITHIDIPVDDMERAKAFYHRLFGWNIAEQPGYEGYPMWQAPNKISGGGFGRRDERLQHPRSYVEVDSIDETITAALGAGGAVVEEKSAIDEKRWWAVISDSEGNQIGLYEGPGE